MSRADRADIPDPTEWTLATVRGAAEQVARARGLDVRAFLVNGPRMGAVRIEVLRAPAPGESADRPRYDRLICETRPSDIDERVVTCWTELACTDLDAADTMPDGVTELVARSVTQVLRMRHGQGAAG